PRSRRRRHIGRRQLVLGRAWYVSERRLLGSRSHRSGDIHSPVSGPRPGFSGLIAERKRVMAQKQTTVRALVTPGYANWSDVPFPEAARTSPVATGPGRSARRIAARARPREKRATLWGPPTPDPRVLRRRKAR